MLPAAPRHIFRQRVKGAGDEQIRLLTGHDLPVVGAAGRTETDAERLAPERNVSGGHHDLRGNVLRRFVIGPGQFTQSASGSVVRIDSVGRADRPRHQHPCQRD